MQLNIQQDVTVNYYSTEKYIKNSFVVVGIFR